MAIDITTSQPVEPSTAGSGSGSSRKSRLLPYVGPCPFERRDESRFFGREREARDLVSLTIAHAEVLLYAPSGAGKSSLINARLIPNLEKKGCEVLPVARVQGPLEKLQAEAIPNLYVFHTLASWDRTADPRQLVSLTLAQFLKRRSPARDVAHAPVFRVAVLDQFEELFTFYPERWKDRGLFLEQVREALEADPSLRVLFAMREDYTASLDPYARLLPEGLRTRFRLEQLRRPAALLAVTGPLKGTDRSFADGVAEKLVESLLEIQVQTETGLKTAIGEFVEPVQLQVVCQTLWEELPAEVTQITEKDLKAFGDVNQALARFYERALEITIQETGIRQGELRRWFKEKLITPAGTRGTVFRGAHDTEGMPNAVVAELVDLHLLRGEFRAGAHWFELTHDRFIRPIQEANRRWIAERAGAELIRQRLETRTREWMEHGQSRERLLDELELREAERWLSSPEAAEVGLPGEAVRAFLQASRTAVESARREKERELEHARALAAEQERRAEAERQRAEAEARRAGEQARDAARLRWLLRALTVITALALLAVIVSVYLGYTAIIARDDAEDQRQLAEASLRDATKARDEANNNLRMALGAADKLLTQPGEQLAHVPQVEETRKKLLEDALAFYKKFLEQRTDPQIRQEAGLAYHRVGDIHFLLGRLSDAEAAYSQELALFEQLIRESPETPSYRRQAALIHGRLGLLMARQNQRRPEAEKEYELTLNLQRELVAAGPGDGELQKELQRDLASTNRYRADWLQKSGKPEEAARDYDAALNIQKKLVKDFNDDPACKLDLAKTYNQLGELLFRSSARQHDAQQNLEQALKLLEELRQKQDNRDYRRHLAVSQHHLGALLKDLGKYREAEAHYRDALKIQDKLVQDFPTVPFYQQDQALTYQDLGILLKDTGRLQGAEVSSQQAPTQNAAAEARAPELSFPANAKQAHGKAIEIRKKLAEHFAGNYEYQQALAHGHSNLGALLGEVGQPKEAEQEHKEALKIREKLAQGFPNEPVYRQEQARTLSNLALLLSYDHLGVFLKGSSRLQEAEDRHRKALDLRAGLASAFPEAPSYRRELIFSLNSLGRLLQDRQQPSEAEKLYRQAVGRAQDLVKVATTYNQELALSYSNLAELLTDLGRLAEAEKLYLKAINLRRELRDQFHEVPVYEQDLAASYHRLGILLQGSGQPQGVQKALEAYGQAIKLRPKNGAFWLAQHFAHAELHNGDLAKAAYDAATEHSRAIKLSADRFWGDPSSDTPGNLEDWRRIAAAASRMIERGKSNWWHWRGRALAHAALGEWSRAAADFSRALELKADDPDAWIGRARAHAKLGQFATAAADCQKAIELGAGDWVVWFLLGTVHERRDQFSAAITAYSRAIEVRLSAQQRAVFGASLFGLLARPSAAGLTAAAIARATKAHPQGRELRTLASLGASSVGLLVQPPAAGLVTTASALVWVAESRKAGWAILSHRAYAYNRTAAYDRAIDDYSTVLALNPNYAAAYNNRAVAYMNKQAYADALRDYEAAIRLDPRYALAHANLSEVHRREHRYDKAIQGATEALAINPKLTLAYTYRGDTYYQLEDYERAIDDYSQALKINSRYLEAYSKRGSAYAEQRNYVEAAANYAEGVELIKKGLIVSRDVQVWLGHARLQLRIGDTEGYRHTCEEILTRFGKAPLAETANTIAWACTLAPSAVTDLERPVQLARQAVDKGLPASRYHYLNTLGAALYRAGRWDEAVSKLNEAMAARGQGGTPEDWLYLAMARQRLGDPTEARKWLDKARNEGDQAAKEKVRGPTSAWVPRVEREILRHEAETLLAGADAKSPGQKSGIPSQTKE